MKYKNLLAYPLGALVFKMGGPRSANPYKAGEIEHVAFFAGWDSAKQETVLTKPKGTQPWPAKVRCPGNSQAEPAAWPTTPSTDPSTWPPSAGWAERQPKRAIGSSRSVKAAGQCVTGKVAKSKHL